MLVGQLLGLVGIFLLVAVFQTNDRRTLLRLQIISCLVWSLYYASMGAYTGAGLIFLGAMRSFVFDRYRDHEWVLGAVIITFAIATLITWENWTSIMALIGMILATTALWQKSPRNIRIISLTVAPFWLVYNLLSGSYLGAVADLITFSSIAVAIVRFDIPRSAWMRFRKIQAIETVGVGSDVSAGQERREKLTEETDELLDEIDDVLEENAEEFVNGYIQKGGQ